MKLFGDGEIDEEGGVCKKKKPETLSIRVLAAKTKRTNEYVLSGCGNADWNADMESGLRYVCVCVTTI